MVTMAGVGEEDDEAAGRVLGQGLAREAYQLWLVRHSSSWNNTFLDNILPWILLSATRGPLWIQCFRSSQGVDRGGERRCWKWEEREAAGRAGTLCIQWIQIPQLYLYSLVQGSRISRGGCRGEGREWGGRLVEERGRRGWVHKLFN